MMTIPLPSRLTIEEIDRCMLEGRSETYVTWEVSLAVHSAQSLGFDKGAQWVKQAICNCPDEELLAWKKRLQDEPPVILG